ncbi:MAG: ATP-binding cassette domain-containing protein [Oscillospiraceae bacterium]|nr:ATP-binding cassette domain-containing protein [Oscillospiraceae bacterium]
MNAVEIKNLTKKFGEKTAVNGISLEIKVGELFGLLGINGAGKTTTLRILSCLSKATSGEAFIYGKSVSENASEVKQMINISTQETAVAPNLTVRENLIFIAGIYGYSKSERIKKADKMIEDFSLSEVSGKKAKLLSGGWQRRLSIAMALITEPKVLFLDEPTLGLDVLARRELWSIISKLKGRITIILTTHYLEEAEALSDRIAIMTDGNIKALGTAQELKDSAGCEKFEDAFIKIAGRSI